MEILRNILLFMMDDVLPMICAALAIHTVYLNVKDLRIIKNTQYKTIVFIATIASFLFTVAFGAVLLEADHLFEASGDFAFGPTFIRPITTVAIVALNLMARGRHHKSREMLADANTNTNPNG